MGYHNSTHSGESVRGSLGDTQRRSSEVHTEQGAGGGLKQTAFDQRGVPNNELSRESRCNKRYLVGQAQAHLRALIILGKNVDDGRSKGHELCEIDMHAEDKR
jgi:hypothetical protein